MSQFLQVNCNRSGYTFKDAGDTHFNCSQCNGEVLEITTQRDDDMVKGLQLVRQRGAMIDLLFDRVRHTLDN